MTTKKPAPVFPAPEWMGVSASMAASLAHEIRNPLLSIKGAAQLLEGAVGAEDKTLAQLIITEANRIEQLVATLDPLTPDPSHVAESLNIHEVTEYVRLAARSFADGVTIATDYDPSLPPVRGVRAPLIQALMNLVKNAVEAVGTSAGAGAPLPAGEVGFAQTPLKRLAANPGEGALERTHGRPHPTITLTTRYLAGERMMRPDGAKLTIQVSVTDNGPGVAAEVVPRLFTPFSGTKEGGKGLGLAITAKIIEEHGGLIAYDAPDAGGARFSIYLPVE